jgi:hypothetical protein
MAARISVVLSMPNIMPFWCNTGTKCVAADAAAIKKLDTTAYAQNRRYHVRETKWVKYSIYA